MNCVLKEYQVANKERTVFETHQKVKDIEEQINEDKGNPKLWMEKGLALAEQRLMRESLEAFSKAVSLDPFCGIIYRHRAHRFLSCWRFQEACADFTLASRLVPQNWDVWYHLGLSHFLLGEYEDALVAYEKCYSLSKEDDKLIAVSDWYWMTAMRVGKKDIAEKILSNIHDKMDSKDNIAYYNRLKMYQGKLKPMDLMVDDLAKLSDINMITQGFGISNYYYLNNDIDKSNEIIERVLVAGDKELWSAFGYLAAMTDKKNRKV